MHHVVGIIGILSGMIVGFGIPCAATIALLSEISTFFLNYRNMYSKEDMNESLPLACQILFFISYTVIRILIFPILAYQLILTILVTWPTLSIIRRIAAGIVFVQFILMFSLNLYWYSLVLKGLKKLMEANGCLKKPVKT